jgi:hypothetical protein
LTDPGLRLVDFHTVTGKEDHGHIRPRTVATEL